MANSFSPAPSPFSSAPSPFSPAPRYHSPGHPSHQSSPGGLALLEDPVAKEENVTETHPSSPQATEGGGVRRFPPSPHLHGLPTHSPLGLGDLEGLQILVGPGDSKEQNQSFRNRRSEAWGWAGYAVGVS